MGIISCVEDNTSSKGIVLACMDWQCKSLRAFEFQVASLEGKKKYIYVA